MAFFTFNIDTRKDRLFANCRPIYIVFPKSAKLLNVLRHFRGIGTIKTVPP